VATDTGPKYLQYTAWPPIFRVRKCAALFILYELAGAYWWARDAQGASGGGGADVHVKC
jgi:hypothetical protein